MKALVRATQREKSGRCELLKTFVRIESAALKTKGFRRMSLPLFGGQMAGEDRSSRVLQRQVIKHVEKHTEPAT